MVSDLSARKDAVFSQLIISMIHIVVALAAEIDISSSVITFEDMTRPQMLKTWYVSLKMKPKMNIILGHQVKTNDCQWFYFYIQMNHVTFEEPLTSLRVLWNPNLGNKF